jgi:hypothetical protein
MYNVRHHWKKGKTENCVGEIWRFSIYKNMLNNDRCAFKIDKIKKYLIVSNFAGKYAIIFIFL